MANQTWSNIAVVGAGALGCYFGGLLAQAGAKVTLIGRPSQVDASERGGLVLLRDGSEERISVAATTDIAAVAKAGLILFCVKSLDTEDAAKQMAPHVAPDAVILSLQNGVDNPERIRRHIGNQVVPVLVYVGANVPAPGTVKHTGGGDVVIGQTSEFRTGRESDRGLLNAIAELLTNAGLSVRISDSIEADLWTKLVMNCAYNAICALSGARYGQMVASPEIRDIMHETVIEVVQVAKAKGIDLPGNIVETVFALADGMPQTMSSTAQDIAKGRRTEIGHLNGYVVRQGEALGIPTPVNRTLNALMKMLEQAKLTPTPSV